MFWGSVGWQGVEILEPLKGIMIAETYRDILARNVSKSVKKLRVRGSYIWQQDNDPKHTARIVKEWVANNQLPVMEWPAQSPDLNIIEQVWSELERRLADRRPKNKEDLIAMATQEWDLIPKEAVQKLINSIPDRIAAVIRAKGGNTKY